MNNLSCTSIVFFKRMKMLQSISQSATCCSKAQYVVVYPLYFVDVCRYWSTTTSSVPIQFLIYEIINLWKYSNFNFSILVWNLHQDKTFSRSKSINNTLKKCISIHSGFHHILSHHFNSNPNDNVVGQQ